MTREELDFIGSMNMCDEISNVAYKKIVCHCREQEPCEDCISRQAVDEIKELMTDINGDTVYAVRMSDIRQLPSVNPQYTEDEIQKTQDLEQAEIQKAYELGRAEGQECEDAISRQSLKRKLKEHHDFFVNAYGGFSNLPQNDKARVDEITNCIAMVVNEPPVNPQPKTGHWIDTGSGQMCSRCGEIQYGYDNFRCFCAKCGAKMVEPQEREG